MPSSTMTGGLVKWLPHAEKTSRQHLVSILRDKNSMLEVT